MDLRISVACSRFGPRAGTPLSTVPTGLSAGEPDEFNGRGDRLEVIDCGAAWDENKPGRLCGRHGSLLRPRRRIDQKQIRTLFSSRLYRVGADLPSGPPWGQDDRGRSAMGDEEFHKTDKQKTKTKMTAKSRARRRAKTSITSARSARKRTANRNAEILKEAADKLVQTGTEWGGRAPTAGKEKASNGRRGGKEIAIQHRRTVVLAMRRVSPPIYIREIAKRLGVSKTTIMSDIAAIREEAGSFEVSERKAMIWDTEQFYAQLWARRCGGTRLTRPRREN